LIGGDGSGKSTCVHELDRWLSTGFATMLAQLGNPPRSFLTLAVGSALKVELAAKRAMRRESCTASWLELLRHLCAARDCYRLYERVQRFTAGGGIAVCDRYPVSELPSHLGPRIAALVPPGPNPFTRLLQSVEASYYQRTLRPDVLFVLRLDPELAVARKPEEPAEYVRTRGRTVWDTDWAATGAQVVDASRPLHLVLDDLKARVWSAL
jgi:thymidylate kinase